MRVACKTCGAAVDLPPGADPHVTTWCGCCPERHHHGEAAASCGPHNHEGPCWNPPAIGVPLEVQPGAVSERPAGCGVCRPFAVYLAAGSPA